MGEKSAQKKGLFNLSNHRRDDKVTQNKPKAEISEYIPSQNHHKSSFIKIYIKNESFQNILVLADILKLTSNNPACENYWFVKNNFVITISGQDGFFCTSEIFNGRRFVLFACRTSLQILQLDLRSKKVMKSF